MVPPRSSGDHQEGSVAQVLIDVDRFPHLGGESGIVGLLLANAARRLKQISQKAGCRNITVMGRGVKSKGNHPASDEPLQLELHGIESDRTPQIAYEMVHHIIEEEDRTRAAKGKGGRSQHGGWSNSGEWDNTSGGSALSSSSWQQQQKGGEGAEWEGASGGSGGGNWGPAHGRAPYKGGSWSKGGGRGMATGGNRDWYGGGGVGSSAGGGLSSSSATTAGGPGYSNTPPFQQEQQPSTQQQQQAQKHPYQGKGKGSRGGKGWYDGRITTTSSSSSTAVAPSREQRSQLPAPPSSGGTIPPPNEPVGRNPAGSLPPPTKPVNVEETLPEEVFEQGERTGQEEAIAYERRMEHWREYAAKRRRLGGYENGASTITLPSDFSPPENRTVSMIAQALHVALVDAMKKSPAVANAPEGGKKCEGIPLRAVEETFYSRWNIPLSLNMLGFDSVLSFINAFDQAFEIVEVVAYSGVKFVKPLDEPEFSYKDYVVLRDVDPTAMSVDTVTADGDSPMTSAGSSPQVSEEAATSAPRAAAAAAGGNAKGAAKPRRGKRKAGDSAAKTQLLNLLQLIKSLQSQQINQAKILNQMEAVAVAHESVSQQQTKGVASPLHQVIQVMADTHRHQGEHLTRLFGLVEGQLASESS